MAYFSLIKILYECQHFSLSRLPSRWLVNWQFSGILIFVVVFLGILEKVSKFGNFRANLVDFGLRGKPLNDNNRQVNTSSSRILIMLK